VLVLDLDPQANLTALCVEEARLEELWSDDIEARQSIFTCIRPIMEGFGDIAPAPIEQISSNLALIPGDPVLIDVGPNLGALNRTALIASQHVVVPLGADLFSIQALRNLGPTLREWRGEWAKRLPKNPDPKLSLPEGEMEPVGYVVMQPSLYGDGITKAHAKWLERIPRQFGESLDANKDSASLGVVKHLRSLMPLAHQVRKPGFHLRPADGALGAMATAAQQAGREFKQLARRIAGEIGIDIRDATR
jgi:hypothetical protein